MTTIILMGRIALALITGVSAGCAAGSLCKGPMAPVVAFVVSFCTSFFVMELTG